MTSIDSPVDRSQSPLPRALIFAALLFGAQLIAIGTIFKHAISFRCLDNWPPAACAGASGALIAVYCTLGALALFAFLRPAPFRALAAQAGTHVWPLALNLAGAVFALLPVTFLK
ncbi:MAG: hypothetical protein AAFO70_09175, partial [Pseudomonadota bacterium]